MGRAVVEVSGAGTEAANGTYSELGNGYQLPHYEDLGSGNLIWADDSDGIFWAIADGLGYEESTVF